MINIFNTQNLDLVVEQENLNKGPTKDFLRQEDLHHYFLYSYFLSLK